MGDVDVRQSLSYQELRPHIGSTFHVSTPLGPVVLTLVAVEPHVGVADTGRALVLAWRGPRQPRLADQVLLYHPILPPLAVTWAAVCAEPKHTHYQAVFSAPFDS